MLVTTRPNEDALVRSFPPIVQLYAACMWPLTTTSISGSIWLTNNPSPGQSRILQVSWTLHYSWANSRPAGDKVVDGSVMNAIFALSILCTSYGGRIVRSVPWKKTFAAR